MKKVQLVVFIIFAFIFTGCTKEAPVKEEPTKQEMKFGVLSIQDALPIFLAKETKLIGEEYTIVPFKNTREMDLALETGELDGILTDVIRAILVNKGGTDVKIVSVALGNEAEDGRFAILSSPNSDIASVVDIDGDKIGISENSIIQYLSDRMFEEKSISKDRYIEEPIPDIKLRFEALINDSVALALLPEPLVTFAESQGCNIIIDDTKLNKNYSQSVLVFRDGYLKSNEKMVLEFLAAYEKAGKELNENSEAYSELIAEKARVPKPILSEFKLSNFGEIKLPDEENIEDINNWMLQKQIIDKAYSYDDIVANIY